MHLLFGKRHPRADSGGGLGLLRNRKKIQLSPLKDPKLVIIGSADAIAPTGDRLMTGTVLTAQLEIIFSFVVAVYLLIKKFKYTLHNHMTYF